MRAVNTASQGPKSRAIMTVGRDANEMRTVPMLTARYMDIGTYMAAHSATKQILRVLFFDIKNLLPCRQLCRIEGVKAER